MINNQYQEKIDYSSGKGVQYQRRVNMSKSMKTTGSKTDIVVTDKENTGNVKKTVDLKVIKKHLRIPQERLKVLLFINASCLANLNSAVQLISVIVIYVCECLC